MRATISSILPTALLLAALHGCSDRTDSTAIVDKDADLPGSPDARGTEVSALDAAGLGPESFPAGGGRDGGLTTLEALQATLDAAPDEPSTHQDSSQEVPSNEAATRYQDYFSWSLSDLATGIDPDDVYLTPNVLGSFSRERLEQYAKRISLFTWPEYDPILFTTVVDIPDTGSGVSKVRVQFKPPTSAPRWYLVQASPGGTLGMYTNYGTYPSSGSLSDGGADVVGARFMTASYPRILDIYETAASGDTFDGSAAGRHLFVYFSEVVDVQALSPQIQLAEPARSACALIPRSTLAVPTDSAIAYSCDYSVIKGLSFSVDGSVIRNGPVLSVPVDGPFFSLGSSSTTVYRFELAK